MSGQETILRLIPFLMTSGNTIVHLGQFHQTLCEKQKSAAEQNLGKKIPIQFQQQNLVKSKCLCGTDFLAIHQVCLYSVRRLILSLWANIK